jgi:hypothetical protein
LPLVLRPALDSSSSSSCVSFSKCFSDHPPEIPSRTVGALCFSGGWSEKHFEKETQELLDELLRAGLKTKGGVFTMLYNPPYIPGFLRRNEVAIEVEEQ